jgi:hypothetical protein
MGGLGSGGPRPNSGPKKRSLRDRALTNPRIRLEDVNISAFPSPPPASPLRDWKPTRAQRNRLRKRGRAFLDARLGVYGHTPAEGDTLLRACSALDEADVWPTRFGPISLLILVATDSTRSGFVRGRWSLMRMRKRPSGRRTRPISESAPAPSESGAAKQPHPLYANRWSDGTQRPSAVSLNRKYPRVERDYGAVALVIVQTTDAIACDRGGRDNLTTLQQRAIDHVVECDLLLQAWREYFRRERPYTRQGRMRTGYTAYLQTLDRWMRLASLVGLDRRERDVSIADWLRGDDDERDPSTEATDSGGTDHEQQHEDTDSGGDQRPGGDQ